MSFPALQYAEEVVYGLRPANLYTHLACKRFIADLERGDIWFDVEAADRFYRFARKFKHYKGEKKGQHIELELWQQFFTGQVYGWKLVVDGEQTDILRFHYIYLEVPRKNGKTTLAGIMALYDAYMWEETGAEVYCAATKEDQAKILWKDCKQFAQMSELQHEFEYVGKSVFVADSNRSSFIVPLGRDSNSHDGLNPIATYQDELHAWPNRDLWDVLEDAFGARVNWHMVSITTAGHNKHGICFTNRKHVIDILEGKYESDDTLGLVYTVDEEDKERPFDEDVWFKANPNLGTGKQLAYMKSQAAVAQQIPSKRNAFLNKQLDIWTDVAEAWLSTETWGQGATSFDWDDMRGLKCYGAFDLAKRIDLSAMAYLFPPQKHLDKYRLLIDLYCPEEDVRKRSRDDKIPYDLWVKQGWIKATPGKVTDYAFIKHDIIERDKMFQLEEVAFDRHFGGELVTGLIEEGLELVDFGMGYISMGAPTAEFERLVVGGMIEHNNNPVMNWMIGNIVVVKDPAGNMKPDKSKSSEKIDGPVAGIMCLGRHMANEANVKKSPYESRGLRSV